MITKIAFVLLSTVYLCRYLDSALPFFIWVKAVIQCLFISTCRAALLVIYIWFGFFFFFCISDNILIAPSVLKNILHPYKCLGWQFFFETFPLTMSSHCLWVSMVADEESAVNITDISSAVMSHFSLDAFKILFVFGFLIVWLWCVLCVSLNLSYLEFVVLPECVD